VLAPAITGIPELVIPGKTGFLYEPGSVRDFVDQLISIFSMLRRERGEASASGHASSLGWVRHAAHVQVMRNFHREANLDFFVNQLLTRTSPLAENLPDENLVLQQI
jgi:glycosyltransferase involved in cell wall biosynthesis